MTTKRVTIKLPDDPLKPAIDKRMRELAVRYQQDKAEREKRAPRLDVAKVDEILARCE